MVSDIEAARADLKSHGVDVSESFHFSGFGGKLIPGPHPEADSYATFAAFKDGRV